MENFEPNLISVVPISREQAKRVVLKNHYMKTFPSGASLFFGIRYNNENNIKGVAVFGNSIATKKKCKLFGIEENEIIEMQRFWICDSMKKNAESKTLSKIMKMIKKHTGIKVVWTYAGGCKNDCGIVYQSSGFMYLGSAKCNDFYLTNKGEYKNLISVMRFNKAPHLKKIEDKAIYLYGPGEILNTKRYFYFYPICKRIRRVMDKKQHPFPKDSVNWRKDQKWV